MGGKRLKKKHLALFLFGCVLLVTASFIQRIILAKQLSIETQKIKKEVEILDSFARIDKVRIANINKVVSVINRFNPNMPNALKYKIASEINDATMKYENLDVDLICATITHESAMSWNPNVVSPVGALGLMQIMPATGKFLANIEGLQWTSARDILFDPVVNIRLGSRYLSSLIEMYEIDGGLAAYNGGGKRAAKWLAQNRAHGVLFKETQNYVPAVLSLYEEFQTN